jgi:hypothetical protein
VRLRDRLEREMIRGELELVEVPSISCLNVEEHCMTACKMPTPIPMTLTDFTVAQTPVADGIAWVVDCETNSAAVSVSGMGDSWKVSVSCMGGSWKVGSTQSYLRLYPTSSLVRGNTCGVGKMMWALM